jgi:Zn-dependent protease with chaperone function/Zn-finger nucleic acid-binding protein
VKEKILKIHLKREVFFYTIVKSPSMSKSLGLDFYEIQSRQWTKSLFLFSILILFYFLAIGFISIVFLISFGFLLSKEQFLAPNFLIRLLLFNTCLSLFIAAFHFLEARTFGTKFILKRLDAHPPDSSDRYHKQFANTVEEICIASGVPKANPYVIPTFAINSMALIGADKTPNIVVTEGLLAEFTRDEVQAVVSHEMAHIIRGDAFYVTLVCSLANFFERLRQALEPEKPAAGKAGQAEGGGGSALLYLAVSLSSVVMHLLSTLISREREILADAAAVELCRNPKALARAIYKAHLKNSFIGDFNLTYSPLFIVHPESKQMSDGFLARLFSSHPPLMRRVKLLANMVKTSPAKIIEEVWEIRKNREKARTLLPSREEYVQAAVTPDTSKVEAVEQGAEQQQGKMWAVRNPDGSWQGPYTVEELLFLNFFTPLIRVKNLQEDIEAPAREFPQFRNALRNLGKKIPVDSAKKNKCPRCRIPLIENDYEGIVLNACPRCGGKLVDSALIGRVIARKEISFSSRLLEKAEEFKEKFLLNPIEVTKITAQKSPNITCPNCGSRMLPRPYNYQYFIPVDKCLSCYKIWFDADELEILQILIEKI